jgi:hypothetical protein
MVVAMLEPNDFFQQQIQQCSGLAANAVGKSDRDFWLRLARRWEDLLRAKQSGSVETIQKVRFERPIFAQKRSAKRFAKRRAA